uniref:UPF0706 protein At5g01750 family n=1 Tax=Cajanus cajan TaxID=3821 RepID=A0A151QPZ1_CAJCA|nr:UPF0706 protein At5g01750 family [Cajanus cajan]
MSRTSAVLGHDKYCAPFPVILETVRTVKKLGFPDKFIVKNIDDSIIFNLERPSFSIHKRYTLFDDEKNPIVTLHSKRMTAHNRWEVFRGKSDQRNDLLFSVKQHHIIQLKPNLDVFLAANTEEIVCDFMVLGSWSGGSFSVHDVQSNDKIAQVHEFIYLYLTLQKKLPFT